jgi:protoheme IX farnesyltransferase
MTSLAPEAVATPQVRRGRWLQLALDLAVLGKLRLSLLVLATVAAGYFAASFGGVAVLPQTGALLGALVGVALCAMGAAALNQVLERDLDARMERTSDRPLPAGRMSVETAVVLGIGSIAAGTLALHLMVHALAALFGAASSVLYVAVYTPLKRLTTFNTLVGAVTGALPPVIGWTAATGQLEPQAWLLFAIVFVWQLPHFLAIAWLYRADYARAGLRMLPVTDQSGRVTMRQILLFSLLLLPVSLAPAANGLAGAAYFWAALGLGIGFVLLCVPLVLRRSQAAARRLFLASLVYLPALLGLLLADLVWSRPWLLGGGR